MRDPFAHHPDYKLVYDGDSIRAYYRPASGQFGFVGENMGGSIFVHLAETYDMAEAILRVRSEGIGGTEDGKKAADI